MWRKVVLDLEVVQILVEIKQIIFSMSCNTDTP